MIPQENFISVEADATRPQNALYPVRISLVIFTLLLCSNLTVHAQEVGDTDQKDIEQKSFRAAIGSEFTKVISGDRLPGNYATFDVVAGQLNGSGSSNLKNGILSFTLNAAVTEGVSSLFTDSKVNPNVAFGLNYSFLNPIGNSVLIKDADESASLEYALEEIRQDYKRKIAETESSAVYYRSLQIVIADSLEKVGRRIKNLRHIITGEYERDDSAEKLRGPTSEMTKLLAIESSLLSANDSLLTLIKSPVSKRRLHNAMIRRKREVQQKAGIIGATFNWITIGYKLSNRQFFLYDSTKETFSEQVQNEGFTSHQISISYNYFSSETRGYGIVYLAIGANLLLDDNHLTLDKTELTDKRTATSGTVERSAEKKYTAFIGDYTKDLRSLKPYFELYYFPSLTRTIAFHVFPETQFTRDRKPLTNLGLGVFFTFSDANDKEGKAKINAELYVRWNDLNNNLGRARYRFHERNDIGVRIAFPINFNAYKTEK